MAVLNMLMQGGQWYWVIPFSKYSLVQLLRVTHFIFYGGCFDVSGDEKTFKSHFYGAVTHSPPNVWRTVEPSFLLRQNVLQSCDSCLLFFAVCPFSVENDPFSKFIYSKVETASTSVTTLASVTTSSVTTTTFTLTLSSFSTTFVTILSLVQMVSLVLML